jgi:hypothetical protein
MATFLLQSDFKFGEVSPLLFARTSSPIYGNGAKRLRNCLVIPQGGARRRFGTLFTSNLTSIDPNYLNYKTFFFTYADGAKYLLFFTPLALTIFHNDAVVATVVTTYTAADVKLLDLAQSDDLVFITCRGKSPAILSRVTPHATWSLNATPVFTHQPTYDFTQQYDNFNFTVFLIGSATLIVAATNLIGTEVTLTSSTAMFNADYVDGLYFGAGGTIRFKALRSTTEMDGVIIKPFDEKSAVIDPAAPNRVIPGTQSVVTEKMFSATRGWPEKVSFFQNRLWFARTLSLPGLVTGSVFNGFTAGRLNFDDSRVLDTSAVSTVLYGRRATLINHLVSYKSLVVFTTSGVYSTSLDLFEPVTPLNINFINLQSGDITNDLLPNILENNVIFYDRGGSRVKTLVLSDDGKDYQAATLNILSSHLVNEPYSSAVMDASETIDGSYLMIVNNDGDVKGSLAVYNLIQEQGITAWTLQSTGIDPTTEGFRHVVSDGQDVYFIIERIINGSPNLYLEKMSFDYLTDCTIPFTQASSATITGLSALQGLDVDIIAGTSATDIGFEGSHTVSGGAVTINTAVTQGYAGIRYTPLIGTMPLMVATEIGNNVYHPKMIKSLYIDFYESLNITVDDTTIPYFNTDQDLMDTSLVPQTNFDNICPMSGWSPRVEIVISQDAPAPFTIIGIGMNIEV